MNILILTIGQSDLQFVVKDKYYAIEKDKEKNETQSNFKIVQDKLKILLNNNQLEWNSINWLDKNGEKRAKGRIIDLDINKDAFKIITFPLIENLFLYFKNNEISIDKIYLFYTDRQHFKGKIKERFLNSEPYFFNQVFKYFETDILKYYDMNTNIEYINLGKDISNINSDSIYPFIGENFKNISYEKITQIYIAVAGGIPSVRGVVESIGTLYFPERCVVLNQKFGTDIESSKSHLYQKYYRNYNLLRESVKSWNFSKAFEIYNKMSNDSSTTVFRLLNISKDLLYTKKNKRKNIINLLNIFNKEEQVKLEAIVSVLKEDKSFSFIIFLRFLQTFKQNNYWGSTIFLISLFEIFIEETINFNYKDSIKGVKYKDGKTFKHYRWKKINPDWNPEIKKDIFIDKRKEFLKNNWMAIEEILTNILPEDKEEIFKFIKKNMLIESKTLRTMRNDFIHHGKPIEKKELTTLLRIEQSKVKAFFKSSILNDIFIELKKHNGDYFNWLEFFEKILLREIKELKPKF